MTTTPSDYFDLDEHGGVTIVRVVVESIRHPGHAQEFSRDLAALVERDGRNRLVLDLRKTHYLGSTAYAALLGLAKKVDAARGKLALTHVDPDVLIGANIIGLGRIIPIFDDEKQALEAVSL